MRPNAYAVIYIANLHTQENNGRIMGTMRREWGGLGVVEAWCRTVYKLAKLHTRFRFRTQCAQTHTHTSRIPRKHSTTSLSVLLAHVVVVVDSFVFVVRVGGLGACVVLPPSGLYVFLVQLHSYCVFVCGIVMRNASA